MKLTKAQRARLANYGWNVIDIEVDGKSQNCEWISITPKDGAIFSDTCENFDLTGDSENVKLLVVATKEGE